MRSRIELSLVAAAFLIGFGLRAVDLDRMCFAHPENYVPGWDDPAWVTAPPAKRSTLEDVLRANLADGHPPLYFVAMLPWVSTFGTSLEAMRLPSALAGALCVLLLWRLVRREYGAYAGVLAAALLALHGHHVFWSRLARMYAPACLLALVSTLLLLRLAEDKRRRVFVGYVAATAALLWTQVYGFPLVFAQFVYVVAAALRGRITDRRALSGPLYAVILGAPVISLAVYQNPTTEWVEPAWEHWSFGFGFYTRAEGFAGPAPLAAWALPAAAATLALFAAAWIVALLRAAPSVPDGGPESARRPWPVAAPLLALAVTAMQITFAAFSSGNSAGGTAVLYASAALPSLCLAVEFGVVSYLRRRDGTERGTWLRVFASPFCVLAAVPWAAMAAVSLVRPSFTARGAVVFLPYVLAAVAVGAATCPTRTARTLSSLALLALAFASHAHFREVEASPRDYRAFAEKLRSETGPEDLIVIHGGYADPPLLYYLPELKERIVLRGAILANYPDAGRRVAWAVLYDDDPYESDGFLQLGPRTPGAEIGVKNARAIRLPPR